VNQVVACQWSEDEGHYRAVIKKVSHIWHFTIGSNTFWKITLGFFDFKN
jgi:hypothetical protein